PAGRCASRSERASEVSGLVEADHRAGAVAAGGDPADARVARLEPEMPADAEDVAEVRVDHATMADDGDVLARVGGDDAFDCSHHAGTEAGRVEPGSELVPA